ncbi:MAG: hypothetical protein NTU62_06800 [Spirochaetes bacterium]|nr:hypothetical protein [Spirochaetota bacterium]
MDKLFHAHVKAFLLSQQISDAPDKNLAKIRVIANSNPAGWDGKLPATGVRVDPSFCKLAEATARRPVVPWWWYAADKEPVPDVVRDICRGLTFDFALVYPKANAWVYVNVEPSAEVMELMARQEHLKAFILMSLINKNFPRSLRESRRVRLGELMKSRDVQKIFTFVAFREDNPAYRTIPAGLPVLSRLVHSSSKTSNWSIRLPKEKYAYGSFREIIPGL